MGIEAEQRLGASGKPCGANTAFSVNRSYGAAVANVGVSIDQAIEYIGVGKTQWTMLVVTGVVSLADFVETIYLSYVTEVLRCEWNLTHGQAALILSIVFLGEVVGSFIWGYVAGTAGRRSAFLVSSGMVCVFGFASAAVQGSNSMLFMRFLVGVGVGGIPISYDLLAEALPVRGRGGFLQGKQMFWAGGGAYVCLCGWGLLDQYGWRVFTIASAIPSLVGFLAGLLFISESPRWLVDVGRSEEALAILNCWAERNGRNDRFDELVLVHDSAHPSPVDLFMRESLRGPLLKTQLVWFCATILYMAFVLLPARVFQESVIDSHRRCEMIYRFGDLNMTAASDFIGIGFAMLLNDWLGRVGSQMAFCFVSGWAILAIGIYPWGPSALLVMVCTGRATATAVISVTWVHTVELFPTAVRSAAHELAFSSGKVGAMITPFIVSRAVPLDACGEVVAVLAALAALSVYFLPETAGKPLDHESSVETA